ncbi:MAG: ABC transporter substrate-binding protein [Nocardioides sp.]|uniref:ABC transporter substrate-binding protein n=1 Tax=Nocardioides sp. TaxID=35761 RepID=UPI0039E268D3
MRLTRRALVTTAATVLGLGGLVACGSSSNSTGGGAGGTLTLITSTAPSSINPLLVGYGNSATQTVDLAYSSFFDWLGGDRFEPVLATGYKFIGSGNKEIRITLRKGLKFSDGAALNAQAEKTFLEYFMDAKAQGSETVKRLVKSISTPNETTVDIKFTQPYPDAPLLFSDGGAWGSPISPKALSGDTDQLGYHTYGAGAYELDSTVSGSTYTYVPNPNYYDTSAQHWDKVVVKVIANTDSALQTVKGTAHSVMQGTWKQKSQASSASLTETTSGAQLTYMLMLTDRAGKVTPALGDVKVRQALNYAVDRSAIADLVNGTANEQIVAKGTAGYYSDPIYSQDAAKAKELLTEAGYPDGFSFKLLVPGYEPTLVSAAQVLADDLAKANITMKIVTAPTFQQFLQQQSSMKYSADFEQWESTTMFSAAQQLIEPNGYVNKAHDSDADLNKQIAKASVLTGSAATNAWQDFSQLVSEKAWFVPLASTDQVFYSNDVTVPVNGLYPNPVTMS